MFTLIRGSEVYAPDYLGITDVLICNDLIIALGEALDQHFTGIPGCGMNVVDGKGKMLIPGLVDQHIHFSGGGGEGGFSSRIPELDFYKLVEAGITTAVGVLGTDGISRNPLTLYAKAREIEEKGIQTLIYTGSYQIPAPTITGSIQKDIMFVNKVIGVGEISISDNRSFEPTLLELSRLAAEVRNAALLSGKPGIVLFHLGDSRMALDIIFELLSKTSIPISNILPTHCNRNRQVFQESVRFWKMGGWMDLTAVFQHGDASESLTTIEALEKLTNDIDEDDHDNHENHENQMRRVTVSSDANGSNPVFDSAGNIISNGVGSCMVLLQDLKAAYNKNQNIFLTLLKALTINPARLLKIDEQTGSIEVGKKADLLLLDGALNIVSVYASGKELMSKNLRV